MSVVDDHDPLRSDESSRGLDRPAQPPQPAPWKLAGGWNIPDVAAEEPNEPGRPQAALVNFHYLRAAVRRRWLRCLLPGALGLLLGAGFLVESPSPPTATTMVMLSRNATDDGASAMATDMSFLSARTVAERTIQALGLTVSPEDLLKSLNAEPKGSSQVLQLTMTAPSAAEAVRRLDKFSHEYLDFRTDQVLKQSTALINGYAKQIAELQAQVEALNPEIQALGERRTATDRLAEAITERAKLNGQIDSLQNEEQELALQQDAVRVATRVVDPAVPIPASGRRHAVLVLASSLIAGLSLGFGLTVLRAILSDRLWLRTEVGSALKTTVPLSVRRLAPPSRLLGAFSFLPWIRARVGRRSVDRQLMARALAQAVTEPGRRQSLTVLCLNNSAEMRFAVVAAALELGRRGVGSMIVDLTVSGDVESAVARVTGTRPEEERPEVFRPSVVPSLTKGPSDLERADWDDVALVKAKSAATLVIADFDPAVAVDYLTAWSDRALVAITAGRSSVELVRTAGELVRVAGLHLQHALLLRAPKDDISSGFTAFLERDGAEIASTMRREPDSGPGRSRVQ